MTDSRPGEFDPRPTQQATMDGYVTGKNGRWCAVIYEGLDPAAGRERRRWHPGGPDRYDAEVLAHTLATAKRERRGNGRARLTFAGHVHRHWLPRTTRLLRPTTLEGYRRLLKPHILPILSPIPCASCVWRPSRLSTSSCSKSAGA